jgi:hypothetical protein
MHLTIPQQCTATRLAALISQAAVHSRYAQPIGQQARITIKSVHLSTCLQHTSRPELVTGLIQSMSSNIRHQNMYVTVQHLQYHPAQNSHWGTITAQGPLFQAWTTPCRAPSILIVHQTCLRSGSRCKAMYRLQSTQAAVPHARTNRLAAQPYGYAVQLCSTDLLRWQSTAPCCRSCR